jgi:hypothetical protein
MYVDIRRCTSDAPLEQSEWRFGIVACDGNLMPVIGRSGFLLAPARQYPRTRRLFVDARQPHDAMGSTESEAQDSNRESIDWAGLGFTPCLRFRIVASAHCPSTSMSLASWGGLRRVSDFGFGGSTTRAIRWCRGCIEASQTPGSFWRSSGTCSTNFAPAAAPFSRQRSFPTGRGTPEGLASGPIRSRRLPRNLAGALARSRTR